MSDETEKMIEKALKAYGVQKKHVVMSRVDGSQVVFATAGGAKRRWAEGDDVQPLTQIQITGINPDAAKRKPIAGKPKDQK